ncbi:MAG: hypothetical protein DRR08_22880 [Candidatus Parabeggiatoa sp. nov. 2]|nr:MAG: hypothetical protein B6247_28960 [Beggiatoa sp. 4572_84]RKZ55967.1 MAG: hypothetical protein DRR08_22880 [Gammaproteobacteria bacterium]
MRAESFHQHALAIREKVLGAEHADMAQRLNNMALIYNDLAQYARAKSLFERALLY